MKLALGLALTLLSLTPARAQPDPLAAAAAPPGAYQLDATRSRLVARVRVGFWRYALRFHGLSGRFAYNPESWRATQVAIVVDPHSAEAAADGGSVAGMFEPDRFPQIRFASTRVVPDGAGRGELAGQLTLHGVTRPVAFAFAFHGAQAANAGARLRFTGTGRIRRSDFRMGGGIFSGDDVDLTFAVEFAKAPPSAESFDGKFAARAAPGSISAATGRESSTVR